MDLSAQMFKDIPSVISYHYKNGNINWPMGIYITLVHVVAFVGVLTVPKCSYDTLLFAFALWPIRLVNHTTNLVLYKIYALYLMIKPFSILPLIFVI